jgi:hypothetical protein
VLPVDIRPDCFPDYRLCGAVVAVCMADRDGRRAFGPGDGAERPNRCRQPHQFGIATGALNFFRLLGGTIVVAAFGAIVLGNVDAAGELTLEPISRGTVQTLGSAASDLSAVFAWVFAAACTCLAAALAALSIVEEHPLRGPASAHPKIGRNGPPPAAE